MTKILSKRIKINIWARYNYGDPKIKLKDVSEQQNSMKS